MNLSEFQVDVLRTVNPKLSHEERIHHAFAMLPAEAGEVSSILQKMYQGRPINPARLKDELGDVLYAVMYIAAECDIDPDEILDFNVAKRTERYPLGFDAARSNWRDARGVLANAEPVKPGGGAE